MVVQGNILKMKTVFSGPVEYYLSVGSNELKMNDLIGRQILLEYLGEINCIRCGRKTGKSFFQGYCYPCYTTAPETEPCVLNPELCRAHLGEARDLDYAKGHCLIDHVVYLSMTSGIKVGVTRNTQVPFRWIDQGAVRAIELARTPNRFLAGVVEVALKKYVGDKTNWRGMLKNEYPSFLDLRIKKCELVDLLPGELKEYISENNKITTISYPVAAYPVKVVSLNLDKTALYQGKITGIKGQYILFEDNRVLNIRKFGGYRIRLSY
jgi:hypothetical protein